MAADAAGPSPKSDLMETAAFAPPLFLRFMDAAPSFIATSSNGLAMGPSIDGSGGCGLAMWASIPPLYVLLGGMPPALSHGICLLSRSLLLVSTIAKAI